MRCWTALTRVTRILMRAKSKCSRVPHVPHHWSNRGPPSGLNQVVYHDLYDDSLFLHLQSDIFHCLLWKGQMKICIFVFNDIETCCLKFSQDLETTQKFCELQETSVTMFNFSIIKKTTVVKFYATFIFVHFTFYVRICCKYFVITHGFEHHLNQGPETRGPHVACKCVLCGRRCLSRVF